MEALADNARSAGGHWVGAPLVYPKVLTIGRETPEPRERLVSFSVVCGHGAALSFTSRQLFGLSDCAELTRCMCNSSCPGTSWEPVAPRLFSGAESVSWWPHRLHWKCPGPSTGRRAALVPETPGKCPATRQGRVGLWPEQLPCGPVPTGSAIRDSTSKQRWSPGTGCPPSLV